MYHLLRSFEYLEPETVTEAVQVLATYGIEVKVLAGGVDLVARMRRREIKPEYLVCLQKIPGLDYIEGDGTKGVRLGALTTIRSLELSPIIQKNCVLLYEAAHQIASIQVKNMGTAVGNLCAATPASDLACALLAVGAELRIAGTTGERTIPIEDFFIGVNQTTLQPGEMVTEVLLPGLPAGTGSVFLKLVRTADHIAKVSTAVTLTVIGNRCKDVRIALGSVAPTVIRARKAEESLKGRELEQKAIAEAAETAAEEARPITDIRSTAKYRTEMTKILVRRAIEKARDRAMAQNRGRETQ